jgi:Luciferase-like monooxygenase
MLIVRHLAQAVDGVDHGDYVGEELATLVGHLGSGPSPLEEIHAELALEVPDRGAERRLGDVQFLGCSAERAQPRDGCDVLELLASHANTIFSIKLVGKAYHAIEHVYLTVWGLSSILDRMLSNGKSFEGVQEQLADLKGIAEEAGRTDGPRFGLNGFVIVRDTETEARETLREIIAKAHVEAVEGFDAAVKQAGQSTSDKKGMWADSSFEDLVQYNDGFRTQLIGTPEQVARRIIDYRKLGVDLILTGFLHYHEEVERFGRDVLPIVRELELENGLDPAVVPDPAEGLSSEDPLLTAAG